MVINAIKSGECGSQWVLQLLSTSPYPAMRAGNDGTVLYANEASIPLLEIWRNRNWSETSFTISSFCSKSDQEERDFKR